MIEFVVGEIDYIDTEYIVVECNGIGYQIYCGNPFEYSRSKGTLKVFTYQHVREDLIALYGFKSREEKALFTKLLNVSGIGPKGALAILASGEHKQVVSAIEMEDEKFLTKFPGVGKKTARQIILDLKGKLKGFVGLDQTGLSAVEEEEEQVRELDEAIEALKALGYSEREINKVVPGLREENLTTDQYIKKALQRLLQQ
ncbi:Holliday junction branch migration protein RuvA [Pseudalkalibacillus caeni]|uniref:Holliday junction branch migration complex subunit RuvA n=1 Tax=Exobacillus caeni TaxID=2574798 RepID=A0A5R9FI57_9BACL|nr:Holliday junction branch migration protein RuvA [Pseudalkalibacillus caeni]TLS39265.1 Holliday junction branch migration protein RuvA [Pseudalkalibacillus caeni]